MRKITIAFVFVAVIICMLGLFFLFQPRWAPGTFLEYLNRTDTTTYVINERSSYSSSGGDRTSNLTRTIQSEELEDLISELKNVQPAGVLYSGRRTCFYTGNSFPGYFVCFDGNRIVNLLKKEGPSRISWNAIGVNFDFKRSELMSSIHDLKVCENDSDCTGISSGVCDPSGTCSHPSALCDMGCRTAINVKYEFVWEMVPFVEDECITDKCASLEKGEYFTFRCKDNICESVILS